MSFIDDLKNLDSIDWNDFSTWPVAIKFMGVVIVCVGILGAGFWFVIQPKIEKLGQLQTEEQSLRASFANKKAAAINLPAYKRQMVEMNQTFGTLLRQLPNSTEVPDLLVDITQAGLGRGLNFILFKPGRERKKGFYAELPITLKVSGSYHELAQFISDVAALPRIVTINSINIGAGTSKGKGKGPQGRLTMDATAATYRYLTAREQGGGKGKGKGKGKRRRKR